MDNNAIEKTLAKGLTKRHNFNNKFRIYRFKDEFGFHVYVFENTAKREKIHIKRYILDRFRYACKKLERSYLDKRPLPEVKVVYRSQIKFIISQKINEQGEYLIQELDEKTNTVRFMTFSIAAIESIIKLLYHKKLYHPNDLLIRLINYHQLFRFSFTERTDKISGKLLYRTDILSSQEPYYRRKKTKTLPTSIKTDDTPAPLIELPTQQKANNFFKSRLAEKYTSSSAAVNYNELFAYSDAEPDQTPQPQEESKSSPKYFRMPLSAYEVKKFATPNFQCKLNTDEFSDFLRFIMSDRHGEFLLGFEIVDCVFKHNNVLKTFKFPLYYMKVGIRESGKEIIINPTENGMFYLNHLALAHLFEHFSKRKSVDAIGTFFNTLLAQHMNIKDQPNRIYLARTLPIHEEIFTQVRKILFGSPEESGNGGILFDLKTIGAEINLNDVLLYRGIKEKTMIASSLENDLASILQIAHEYPQRFYDSNLGNFLSPETSTLSKPSVARTVFVPAALSKSFRLLIKKLDEHNFVLLEGPPGTGKTHSILQLLIHYICTDRKVLIISEQQSAIQALMEKLRHDIFAKDDYTDHIDEVLAQGIKVVDTIPTSDTGMNSWSKSLKKMLVATKEIEAQESLKDSETEIKQIDAEIASLHQKLDRRLEDNLVARKYYETTEKDIQSILSFMRFSGLSKANTPKHNAQLISEFIKLRKRLRKFPKLYGFFSMSHKASSQHAELVSTKQYVNKLLRTKPKSREKFDLIHLCMKQNHVVKFIQNRWEKRFSDKKPKWLRILIAIKAFFAYPIAKELKFFQRLLNNHLLLLQKADHQIILQLNKIHQHLNSDESCCLAYDIFSKDTDAKKKETINDILLAISDQQQQRDQLVKIHLAAKLQGIACAAHLASRNQPSAMTIINSLIGGLANYDSLDMAMPVLNDLREKLMQTFPVWVCRKQAVSFLFPCAENIFDLVIVDEATQCRVDDALPLLFRASKLLVVGDDKQTVLAKNSALDDYLFAEFGLDEHLRMTQGQALKGGGSNIFGLIKQIKQASVMLDEHYRCPPDIISFSNRYVYHNALKTMQWGKKNAVVLDYSEADEASSTRATRGAYKGIETDMVDRFFAFVEKNIRKIEREEKRKICLDTDVALCYFLLKNEPYIKAKKLEWLRKLNRGNDVLDGAGAALQGKERDYIFYLWDVSKSNMLAFRQGDEEDKRKGELNVLMSRPKKRAYHYLHKDFAKLNHGKSTICDYLWSTYLAHMRQKTKRVLRTRVDQPSPNFSPWRRYSGQLLEKIINEIIALNGTQSHYSVNIGDNSFCVDLILSTPTANIGIVDLARFVEEEGAAKAVVDYYFQIKRATPSITPYFVFIRDLAHRDAKEVQDLKKILG
ncbi:MAG: AAA domain-containing protein [Pseudomonadota bacterium]|nr:AAA domain-containing protein [Pseudomonadota bacterium]